MELSRGLGDVYKRQHRYLEKQAMDTRRDRAEVAQEVLEEYADRNE